MKTIIKILQSALIICSFIVTSITIAQTIHIVDNNPGTDPDFTDLQAAIDAATAGDTIYLQQSGTSYGNITIEKGISIIGRSHSDNSYKSQVDYVNFADGAINVTLKGLSIYGIGEAAPAGTVSDIKIFDNHILYGITLGSSNIMDNVIIQGNVIESYVYFYANSSNILFANNLVLAYTIYFYHGDILFANNIFGYYTGTLFYNYSSSSENVTLSNCIFVTNSNVTRTIDFNNSGNSTFTIENCVTYNYSSDVNDDYNFEVDNSFITPINNQENVNPLFTSVNTTAGSGSIAQPDSFTWDPINDNLNLQAGSTVIDDGIFQGYMFKNLGTPNGYPSLKIGTYSPTVPKNGNLNITITAKTN